MKKTVHDEPAGGLKEYRRKRDFSQTAEPPPRVKKSSAKELMFVIQKHDATRLHYDFRLEMEGVLKSWAVPKGLPAAKGDRRLAVHVEDHPMDYARFEGTIPPGNYGAGTVMVWDIGTYTVKDADPLQALQAGKMHVILKGKKLKGEWALIRLKPRPGDKDNWLIFKAGEEMKPLSARKDDESVLTKRSMAKIAAENKDQWQSDRPAAIRAKNVDPRIAAAVEKRKAEGSSSKGRSSPKVKAITKGASSKEVQTVPELNRLPAGRLAFVEPMKCKLVESPPSGDQWIYEIKFDGFRSIALKDGKNVQLLSRNNKSLNDRFPEVAEAVAKLPFETGVLDGAIVALDADGRSSFQLLQMANMP
ncbi:MAG: DNA polymerase ligase N-terminal domain-containing protein, partial [Limisphaerales bacterium]